MTLTEYQYEKNIKVEQLKKQMLSIDAKIQVSCDLCRQMARIMIYGPDKFASWLFEYVWMNTRVFQM